MFCTKTSCSFLLYLQLRTWRKFLSVVLFKCSGFHCQKCWVMLSAFRTALCTFIESLQAAWYNKHGIISNLLLTCHRTWRSSAVSKFNWKQWLLWNTWFSWTWTATWFGCRVRSRGHCKWGTTLRCNPLDWNCTWRQESTESCWNRDGWFKMFCWNTCTVYRCTIYILLSCVIHREICIILWVSWLALW